MFHRWSKVNLSDVPQKTVNFKGTLGGWGVDRRRLKVAWSRY